MYLKAVFGSQLWSCWQHSQRLNKYNAQYRRANTARCMTSFNLWNGVKRVKFPEEELRGANSTEYESFSRRWVVLHWLMKIVYFNIPYHHLLTKKWYIRFRYYCCRSFCFPSSSLTGVHCFRLSCATVEYIINLLYIFLANRTFSSGPIYLHPTWTTCCNMATW